MHKFQGVSDTLFIPLAGRAYVSRRFPEYFYDAKAIELEPMIPGDSIQKNSPEYTMIAPAARYYNLDRMTDAFIGKHGTCNIVNLGCGLDTSYFRIDCRGAMFYEVDFPEVIAVRKRVLRESAREILLAADIFSLEWAEKMDRTRPTLLIASGVFQYCYEKEILDFIARVREMFKEAELVFDATGRIGIRFADYYVRRTGNTSAAMHFYIESGLTFAEKAGVVLVEQRAFFTDALRILGGKLKLFSRLSMIIADRFHMSMLVHLRLRKEEDC